jgi:tetratricopeptide (TPR) repeat protein
VSEVRDAIERALQQLRSGDLAGADRETEAALRGAPDDPGLLRLRGYVLQTQERFAEAASCYETVVAHDPRDWEIWNNLGNARRAAGDREGAIDALERARLLRPDLAAIHYNLGVSLAEAGRMAEGTGAFAEAARLAPDHPGALLELGKALRHLGRHEEALPPLARAAALAPGAAEVEMERARALSGLARYDEAERAYECARAAQPGLAAAFLEHGLLLERGNRLERLEALLAEAEAQGIPHGDLSHLHALALEREGRFREALAEARKAPDADDPVRKALLIGRLADRLDDAAAAFAAYEEMNRLVAAAHPGAGEAAAAYRDHVAALSDMLTPSYAAGWPAAGTGRNRPAPVFLVGFPRSGTTLLDTLLMGHPETHVLEEEPILQRVGEALGDFALLPGLEAGEAERLRALYFAELDAFDPGARDRMVVDKLPLNILGAPLIHRLFPEAKLIFAERHPCDVVLSCFMQNFDVNDAMANFLDLGDAARLYDLVLGFWTRCRALLPLDVHVLRYEALVADKAKEMRALLAFLGLEWDDGVLDNQGTAIRRGPIATPSYAQVAQPIYGRASGRWQRYRAELAPVLPILAPWAERMGYEMGSGDR